MSSTVEREARRAVAQSHRALRRGERNVARRWAEKAVALAPHLEEPWLLLAALATPRASLEYLKRALEINPQSERARQGMEWAIRRARAKGVFDRKVSLSAPQESKLPVRRKRKPRRNLVFLPVAVAVLAMGFVTLAWLGLTGFSRALARAEGSDPAAFVVGQFLPTATFTSTATLLPSPTATPTLVPTNTPLPTSTPTATLVPTEPPPPQEPEESDEPDEPEQPSVELYLPPGLVGDENWIEVDLTNQRLVAYSGETPVETFPISSGTWLTPTITGYFQIYQKLEAALMYGADYYIPDVPYVMYFSGDYGIHGAYWHNNFGVPVSHGCVNMKVSEAGWLFDFAEVGTWVYVHY
jgi:hypothetical protein